MHTSGDVFGDLLSSLINASMASRISTDLLSPLFLAVEVSFANNDSGSLKDKVFIKPPCYNTILPQGQYNHVRKSSAKMLHC
jgi:hypothetical protein